MDKKNGKLWMPPSKDDKTWMPASVFQIALFRTGKYKVKVNVNGPFAGMNPDIEKFLKDCGAVLEKQLNQQGGKFPKLDILPGDPKTWVG